MATATLQPTGPAAVPRGYPRPAPGRLEQGATVIFGHARKMAARGMAAGTDFMGDVEKTFGTPGPEIGPTPFKPGTVSPGAVIAKLGTAVFAAARTRANALQRQKIQDAQMAYQRAQVEGLKSAAADREARTGIAQKTYDLAAQQYLNPNVPQAPMMTPIAGEFAGKEMPVAEFNANAAAGRTAMTVKARDDQFRRDSRDMALITADMQKSGPTSTALMGRASKLAHDMFNSMKDPVLAERVRAQLERYGLPKGIRAGRTDNKSLMAYQKAAEGFQNAYWADNFNAHVETSKTRLAGIQARQAMSGAPPPEAEAAPVEAAAPAGPPPLRDPPTYGNDSDDDSRDE